MEIKEGMYVRTEYGIGKIDKTRIFMERFEFHLDSNVGKIHNVNDNTYWNEKCDIIGDPSYDLNNLIEVDDYINGSRLLAIDYAEDQDGNCDKLHYEYFFEDYDKDVNEYYDKLCIRTIVTKEQFKRAAYEVYK